MEAPAPQGFCALACFARQFNLLRGEAAQRQEKGEGRIGEYGRALRRTHGAKDRGDQPNQRDPSPSNVIATIGVAASNRRVRSGRSRAGACPANITAAINVASMGQQ